MFLCVGVTLYIMLSVCIIICSHSVCSVYIYINTQVILSAYVVAVFVLCVQVITSLCSSGYIFVHSLVSGDVSCVAFFSRSKHPPPPQPQPHPHHFILGIHPCHKLQVHTCPKDVCHYIQRKSALTVQYFFFLFLFCCCC